MEFAPLKTGVCSVKSGVCANSTQWSLLLWIIQIKPQDVVCSPRRRSGICAADAPNKAGPLKHIQRVIEPSVRHSSCKLQPLLGREARCCRIPLGIVRVAQVAHHSEFSMGHRLRRKFKKPCGCFVAHLLPHARTMRSIRTMARWASAFGVPRFVTARPPSQCLERDQQYCVQPLGSRSRRFPG